MRAADFTMSRWHGAEGAQVLEIASRRAWGRAGLVAHRALDGSVGNAMTVALAGGVDVADLVGRARDLVRRVGRQARVIAR